ncbi:MAG: hypothetical protein NTY53_03815, partial [Kiritimatiellaeota bacterium]|nr:hypothetical protein [Kiritimatiellota bacterium]
SMAYTQNALVGGMVIVNMFGYALGRSGIHRYIRHDYISFLADEGHYQFSGAALWPIPLPGPLVLFWANHQFLMGLIGVSIPILLCALG